ncbi:MAG: PilZ domain-containing protein [Candidatus Hodarchaeota archaeon]
MTTPSFRLRWKARSIRRVSSELPSKGIKIGIWILTKELKRVFELCKLTVQSHPIRKGYDRMKRENPEGVYEKRNFRRFPVTNPVICFRYGMQMNMRTLDVSLGGLKLEANFDLLVGESMDLAIPANNARIRCKGRILAIEELSHKVQARLLLAPASDSEYRKLLDYLHTLSLGRFQKGPSSGSSSYRLISPTSSSAYTFSNDLYYE